MQILLLVNVLMFLFLTYIWSSKNGLNAIIKFIFIVLTIVNVLGILFLRGIIH